MQQAITRLDYSQALALLRIGFGGYFLTEGIDKLNKGWLTGGHELLARLTGPQGSLTRGTVEPIYRPFLEQVVVPHASLFSWLIVFGEMTVGLLLVLGLLTRAAAIGGAWLNLNYMLMKGLANTTGNSDRLFLLAEVVFFVMAAGLVWGLDGWLSRPLATSPLTRWITGLPPRPSESPIRTRKIDAPAAP